MTKKTKKKSNFLGFRLSEDDIDKLDQIAKIENKSRGLIAKQAVRNWVILESFRKTNNMFIISKSIFCKLISMVNDDTLKFITIEMGDLIADMAKYMIVKPMDFENFDIYAKNIVKFLGFSGIKWFNSLDLKLNENKIMIKGLHDLDENFSIFFSKMIMYLLSTHFNFKLQENIEENSSNLIYLEYNIMSNN